MAPLIVVTVIALLCVGLSLRRVLFVYEATFTDPAALLKELRAAKKRGATLDDARFPDGSFEDDVRAALLSAAELRVVHLSETLMELEFSLAHWSRVPRACASITSSVGFLGAAVFLRRGLLGGADGEEAPDFNGLVLSAIGVAAVGIAGAISCALLHRVALREAKHRMRTADELVEWLETYGIPEAGGGEEDASPHAPPHAPPHAGAPATAPARGGEAPMAEDASVSEPLDGNARVH